MRTSVFIVAAVLVVVATAGPARADVDLKIESIELAPAPGHGHVGIAHLGWSIPADHEGEFGYFVRFELWRGGQLIRSLMSAMKKGGLVAGCASECMPNQSCASPCTYIQGGVSFFGWCEKSSGCAAPGIISGVSCSCVGNGHANFSVDFLISGDVIMSEVVPGPGTIDSDPSNNTFTIVVP